MKRPPEPNAANILELYRRRISKIDTKFPPPYFTLLNIDIIQLYILYSDYFPFDIRELFKSVTESELKAIHMPDFELKIQSPLVIHHPKFDRYNHLYKDFESISDGKDDAEQALLRRTYLEKVEVLNKEVSDETILQFYKCILSVKGTDKLRPHLDTLFFVCMFFYNMYWDVYGVSFNGKVSKSGITNLTLSEQPHLYRAHTQTNYVSKLLFDYFKAPKKLGEVNLVVGGKSHITSDPVIINWLVQSLIDSLLASKHPLSLDYLGGMLSHTLSKRKNDPEAMLLELESLANLKPPTHKNEKRKVVRRFCLDIHKAFAYYLGTPHEKFNIVELKVYHNILKSFKMDDFSVRQRESQSESPSNTRDDIVENRLGELLRRGDE